MEAAAALQHDVDIGHQPWRLSAPDVAAACTFGIPGTSVEPAGTNRYQVSHPATGRSALVEVAQPLGPDGIWVVTRITSEASAATAPCTPEAILPAVRQALDSSSGVQIVAVTIHECQGDYPRVFTVSDNSMCGHGGPCVENEQVFLIANAGGWSYLTSGSGISCETDDDLDVVPGLTEACEGLGLR